MSTYKDFRNVRVRPIPNEGRASGWGNCKYHDWSRGITKARCRRRARWFVQFEFYTLRSLIRGPTWEAGSALRCDVHL